MALDTKYECDKLCTTPLSLIHLHNQLNTKHNWYVCLVLRGITLSWVKGKLKV